jgi:hypothetical protein
MRESYRMSKYLLVRKRAEKQSQLEIVFLFMGSAEDLRKKKSYDTVNASMQVLMSLIPEEERRS